MVLLPKIFLEYKFNKRLKYCFKFIYRFFYSRLLIVFYLVIQNILNSNNRIRIPRVTKWGEIQVLMRIYSHIYMFYRDVYIFYENIYVHMYVTVRIRKKSFFM